MGSKTVWKDAKILRYLAFVCLLREAKSTSELGKDGKFDTVLGYGPFAGSVIILHGSGKPVHVHHVLALNAYLDELVVTKGFPSKQGFLKYWANYKKELGGVVSSVPSPYKWETGSVKDKLGVYSPPLVMDILLGMGKHLWTSLVAEMNKMHMGV